MFSRSLALVLLLAIFLPGCPSTDPAGSGLNVPENYDGTNFLANTVEERQLLDDLKTLTAIMKEGRAEGFKVEYPRLTDAYNSLNLKTTDYYGKLVSLYMLKLTDGSGDIMDPMKLPVDNGNGGVYAGHLYDEHGIEMEQLVEKGLFAAALYYQAVQIMATSQLPPSGVDKIVALFGATPVFRNSDVAAQDADVFAAKYCARRDANDGRGFYTRFRDAAKLARAAAEGGTAHLPALRGALTEMRLQWEMSQAATCINYLYAVLDGLSKTTVDDATRSEAMHSLSEAIAFVHGWKGLSPGTSVITGDQVDTILDLMLVPNTEPWTCYVFWQEPAISLPRLVAAIEAIQDVYGFTDRELEDFKVNWVQVQGR